MHQLPGDTLDVPSGKTVYIAGGAIVRGCIRAKNAENVTICGRGEVHPEGRGEGVSIINSRNVRVEGLITTQCPTGGSDSVTISNVKAISSYGWGDGMNVFASNNVLFDGVFCRNSDDCTPFMHPARALKAGCRNITLQNSTSGRTWPTHLHGLHGDAEGQEVMENLNYINIDILDHKEKQIDYQGCGHQRRRQQPRPQRPLREYPHRRLPPRPTRQPAHLLQQEVLCGSGQRD